MNRDEQGNFAPTVSDDDLWALYVEDPSAKKVAKHFELSVSQVRKRLAKIREKMGVVTDPDIDRAGKLEKLLGSIPLHGPGGARLKEASVKLYGIGAKDELTQKIVKEGLDSTGAVYKFDFRPEVQWPAIAPYYNVEVSSYKPLPPADTEFERIFIWGDTQCGWWREDDGSLTPFHDSAAIDAALQMVTLYRPHRVVIIGDLLDFPELGKYRKEPAFAFTLNPAIAYATELLTRIRHAVGPDCIIDFIPGNHEARLTSAIVDNLCALYNIKRTGDPFPLLSIPYLLQFEKLNIRCAEQYPAGQVWLSDDIVCTHAPDKKLRATQICGHLVRATVDSDTFHYRSGPKTYRTIIVPGVGNYGGKPADKFRLNRTNIPSNVARSGAEQAMATVEITRDGKHHSIKTWDIVDGFAFFKDIAIQGHAEQWSYDAAA